MRTGCSLVIEASFNTSFSSGREGGSVDPTFFLGLLLAIPVGIGTNLAAPRLDRWWSERSSARRKQFEQRSAARAARVAELRADPDAFTHRLLWVTLRIAFISAVITIVNGASGIIVALLYATNSPVYNDDLYRLSSIIAIVSTLSTTIGSVLILRLLSIAFADWREVKKA
jgi:hypothetical protein